MQHTEIMSRYSDRYSDDESIDVLVRRVMQRDRSPVNRGPPPAPPASTAIHHTRDVREGRPYYQHQPQYAQPAVVIEAKNRDRSLKLDARKSSDRRIDEDQEQRERDRRRAQLELREEELIAQVERQKRRSELRDLKRQKRAYEKQGERTWEREYDISTLRRQDDSSYEPITLRAITQTEGHDSQGDWTDVAHDIFDVRRGRDLTFQMEFPIHLDQSNTVEVISCLRRQGNFAAARDMFMQDMRHHLSHPFTFTQYAELLFDMGDYKSLVALEPKPVFGSHSEHQLRPAAFQARQLEDGRVRFVYLRRGRRRKGEERAPHQLEPGSNGPSDLYGLGLHETRLLHLKWRLLQSLALSFTKGTVSEALADAKDALHSLVIHDEVGSTEVRKRDGQKPP